MRMASTCSLLMPGVVARSLAGQYGLKLFDPPYASPPIAIDALWRSDLSEAPSLEWLRVQLRAAAAEL